KAVAKSKQKAPHVKAAPHVNAGPRTAPSSHMKVNRQPSSTNLTKQKVHENRVTKQQLHKSPTAPANELPAVQSHKHELTNGQTTPPTSSSSRGAGIIGIPATGIRPGVTIPAPLTILTMAQSTPAKLAGLSTKSSPTSRPAYRNRAIIVGTSTA